MRNLTGRSIRIVPCLFFLSATVALASPPSATAYKYGGSTSGNRSTWASDDNQDRIITKADPLSAITLAKGKASYTRSDIDKQRSATDGGTWELQATPASGYTYTWSACGTQQWSGGGKVAAGWFCDATLSLSSMLAFQGDLALRNVCMVEATSSASDIAAEIGYEVALKFGVTIKRTKTQSVADDEDVGSDNDSNSGNGTTVRVDSTSVAKAKVICDSNGISSAVAGGETVMYGAVQLSIVCSSAEDSGITVMTMQDTPGGSRVSPGVTGPLPEPPPVPKPGADRND